MLLQSFYSFSLIAKNISAKLYIAGDGELRSDITSLIAQYHLQEKLFC